MIGKLFSWRRPAATVIPDPLWEECCTALPFLDWLLDDERQRLRALAESFVRSKSFSAGGDLELTDTMCVTIAIQACLPILNLGLSWYDDWSGIIVYAGEFVIPRQLEDEDGVVHVYDEVAAGEAWLGGPVLISWQDAQMAGAGAGYNVVIHEFVHKLDMRSGDADGVPPLPGGDAVDQWVAVLDGAYDDFCARIDGGDVGAIDPYAAEHPAEFFAVTSELFFELPHALQAIYPDLYAHYAAFYRLDPATRLSAKP
jgi:Mlc titration factor MtfA (ptsG expression regulator)